ncbi:hypothetical protein BaRGS_00030981 [Batillaria attramentaria]|uniref:Uncharacterized protein n=1 Tax=Batillaria attramentaria TaxID=370345 RepID=A0ABD0JSH4_9CAEN
MSAMEEKEVAEVNGLEETMEDDDDCMIVEEQSLSAEEQAESKKTEGNGFYKQQKYRDALECYTQAINLCPTCAAYYGNRAATYMMLKRYKDALADAQQSVHLDPAFVKGYIREGKCHLILGNALAALKSFNHVLEHDPDNAVALHELKHVKSVQEMERKVELNIGKKEYRTAVFCLDRCLDHSPASVRYKVLKAEALTYLDRQQEAQELANDVLGRDGMNADALYVRGLSLYYRITQRKPSSISSRSFAWHPTTTRLEEPLGKPSS